MKSVGSLMYDRLRRRIQDLNDDSLRFAMNEFVAESARVRGQYEADLLKHGRDLNYDLAMVDTYLNDLEAKIKAQFPALTPEVMDELVVGLFLFAGLDVKGRLSMLAGRVGLSVSLALSFNPLGAVGIITQAGFKAAGSGQMTVVPVAIRMPTSYSLSLEQRKKLQELYSTRSSKTDKNESLHALLSGDLKAEKGTITRPVQLLFYKGTTWTFKAGASFEAGVGWRAEVGLAQKESGEQDEPKTEVINEEIEDETALELLALRLEATATAKASAELEHTTLFAYADERFSARAEDTRGLRKALPELLRAGSDEGALVIRAAALVNRIDDRLTGTLGKELLFDTSRFTTWHFNTGKVCVKGEETDLGDATISTGVDAAILLQTAVIREAELGKKSPLEPKEKLIKDRFDANSRDIKDLIEALQAYAQIAGMCWNFLMLSSTQGGGGLEARAGVTVEGNVVGLAKASGGVAAGMTLEGRYAFSRARFQLGFAPEIRSTPEEREKLRWELAEHSQLRYVGMSVDSQITYSQVHFAAKAGIEKSSIRIRKRKVRLEETGLSFERSVQNRMTYACAIVYWSCGTDLYKPGAVIDKTDPDLGSKYARKYPISTGVGTGVVFGSSFLLKNVKSLYATSNGLGRTVCEAGHEEYLDSVAKSLNITRAQLVEFLNDEAVVTTLVNCLQIDANGTPLASTIALKEEGAVLLEACFRVGKVHDPRFLYYGGKDSSMTRRGIDGDVEVHFLALSPNLLDEFTAAGKPRELESIRLRFRLCDHDRKKKTLFALGGAAIAGNELSFKISEVSDVQADAIIDLVTKFVSPPPGVTDPADLIEAAVPGAILFTQ